MLIRSFVHPSLSIYDKLHSCACNTYNSRACQREDDTLHVSQLHRKLIAETAIDSRNRISLRPTFPVTSDRRV